jgi:hypothetical protein
VIDDSLEAWESALPAVLALMNDQHRGMFRQELQRFLAFTGMDPRAASRMSDPLRELLLGAARAAGQPRAIAALREPDAGSALVTLCDHILTCWRDAEAEAANAGPAREHGSEPIFFGPRLGGPGRAGAVERGGPDDR